MKRRSELVDENEELGELLRDGIQVIQDYLAAQAGEVDLQGWISEVENRFKLDVTP